MLADPKERSTKARGRARLTAAVLAQTLRLAGFALVCLGCGARKVPSPEPVLREYQQAVGRKDADKLYSLLSEQARKEISPETLKRILARDHAQLSDFAERINAADVKETVELQLSAGTVAELELLEGRFWITSTGGLPPRPRTAEQAAVLLKQAVETRSYDQALALMSHDGRAKLEAVFERLDTSLSELSAAVVEVKGTRATIEFPSGLLLELKQEQGVWKVDEVR